MVLHENIQERFPTKYGMYSYTRKRNSTTVPTKHGMYTKRNTTGNDHADARLIKEIDSVQIGSVR